MRRHSGWISIACVVLALGLTACPSSKAKESQPSPSSSTTLLNTPWQLVDKADSTLKLRVYEGGCFSFQRLEVQETDQEVVIAAKSTLDTSGQICGDELASHDETVTLKRPLGTRTLTPAPLSEEAKSRMGTLPSPRSTPPSSGG